MTEVTPTPEEPATLTPSELARSARLHIESKFNSVRVTGELSNFRRPSSGHWYFSIKDDSAQIRCAMFVNRNRFAQLQPKDGLAVLMRGRVSLYEARGDFQLIVDHMEAAGEGALRLAYEALLKQLHKEGLTDPERKRALPTHPQRIAVITSQTGAALQDMLSVWRRRYALAEIIVIDVAVQGANSEGEVLAAIERLPELDADLAIVTRGGGSLEDLWTFNMESVARALAECPIPTISAIGHEIDVAITDYVADVRAPTPSAAAELCTPHVDTLVEQLASQQRHLDRQILNKIRQLRGDLATTRAKLVSPAAQVQQWMQRMDDLAHRANRATQQRLQSARFAANSLQQRLAAQHPQHAIDGLRTRFAHLQDRANSAARQTLARKRAQADELGRTLHAVSPLNTLGRGYAIVTDAAGTALTNSADMAPGQRLQTHLVDGYADVTVDEVHTGGGLAAPNDKPT